MKRIGIISDTHGYWDERYEQYLGECDEIWHAGDIGSMEVADRFEAMKPIFRAVHGNAALIGLINEKIMICFFIVRDQLLGLFSFCHGYLFKTL